MGSIEKWRVDAVLAGVLATDHTLSVKRCTFVYVSKCMRALALSCALQLTYYNKIANLPSFSLSLPKVGGRRMGSALGQLIKVRLARGLVRWRSQVAGPETAWLHARRRAQDEANALQAGLICTCFPALLGVNFHIVHYTQ